MCQIWNAGEHNLHKIAELTGLGYSTVTKYLQLGRKFGWTSYGTSKHRPIECLDNNYIFANARICAERSEEIFGKQLKQLSVNATARGRNSHTQGIHFRYITEEQFSEIKKSEPSRVYE